jgi:hypothetical protein
MIIWKNLQMRPLEEVYYEICVMHFKKLFVIGYYITTWFACTC